MAFHMCIQIHPVSAENNRWNTHHDRYHGKYLHNYIQVIGDNRRKSTHHTAQDPTVYIGHLDCLLILYDNILQKVCILRILLDGIYFQKLFPAQLH